VIPRRRRHLLDSDLKFLTQIERTKEQIRQHGGDSWPMLPMQSQWQAHAAAQVSVPRVPVKTVKTRVDVQPNEPRRMV